MNGRFLIAGLVAGLALAGAGFSRGAEAAEARAVAPVQAEALDKVAAEFTRHNREHRMWEIQRNTERQQRGRGYGYDRRRGDGYGYGRGDGYGDGRRYGRERRYGY